MTFISKLWKDNDPSTPASAAQLNDLESRIQALDASKINTSLLNDYVTKVTMPSINTTLPSSPYDGQEIYYQNSTMASAGIVWNLRYQSALSGSYKWTFIGGAPLVTKTGFTASFTTNSTINTWQAEGPSLVTPLAGDYEVYFMWSGLTTNAQAVFDIDLRSSASVNSGITGTSNNPGEGPTPANGVTQRNGSGTLLGLSAATTLQLYSLCSVASQTGSHRYRSILIRPMRVG